MAFSVAYYDLLNKNIRHIYSSLPANGRFRCNPSPGVTLNPHDGCVTPQKTLTPQQPQGMPESLYRRLWAYSTEYRSPMPRAPAFRCMTPQQVDTIVTSTEYRSPMWRAPAFHCMTPQQVDTIVTSTVYGSPMPRTPAFRCMTPQQVDIIVTRVSHMTKTHRRRRQSYGQSEECRDDVMASRSGISGGRRCRSVMEMEELTERVTRPTTACQIRSDLREGQALDPVEVVTQRSASRSGARSAR